MGKPKLSMESTYILSLLNYTTHLPYRLMRFHALRTFVPYALLEPYVLCTPSCMTCLTYVPYLSALHALFARLVYVSCVPYLHVLKSFRMDL